jgi:hypothetical protein
MGAGLRGGGPLETEAPEFQLFKGVIFMFAVDKAEGGFSLGELR